MPPTMPARTDGREARAGMDAGTVTLTNICLRSRLSASAELVIGLRPFREWRELAEALEPAKVKETSFRVAAADDEAIERLSPSHWSLLPGTLRPECQPSTEVMVFIAA